MKFKKVAALLASGVLVASLGLVGCSGGSSNSQSASSDYTLVNPGTLTVISSEDFPPFENLENGEGVGFDIDIINEVGNRLGLQVDIQNYSFDGIVPAIAANSTADLGISGITITPEREDQILFSDPYFDSNQAIVVMKNSGITDVSQLKGATIAAQSGSTGSDWAKENIENANVVDYQEATACFAALQAGQAQAVSIDLPVAAQNIKTGYSDATIIQETPTGEQYGIVISKDNPGLQAAVNQALSDMKADGTYDQIYSKWFETK